MSEIVKRCKIHGDLTIDQTRKDGKNYRCKACRIATNKKSYYENQEKRIATSTKWKLENREHSNAWEREDRKKNPEKYRRYEENYKKKHGMERIRKMEVARIHGLSIEEYDAMFEAQNHKCLICNNEETRLGKDGKTVTPLSVDHCHYCEENGNHVIRGLLCRSCNTAIGSFNDDINLLQSAITYLQRHEHLDNAIDTTLTK